MTELLIDGQAVVLPKGFNVTVKRENPFITKNGEYTYDVTLDLDNPTNAQLYKHLNRLNSVQEIKEKRPAVLIADNRVYCNGTEVITGWTQDTVTIQIASGNSELNYFIGGDLMISALDMKTTIPGFDGETITGSPDYMRYIEKTYPEVEYCLAPVINESIGEVHNKWCLQAGRMRTAQPATTDIDTVTPQPFLMAYIKETIRALGYQLEYNQLENTLFKGLYICHTERTKEWNKMLPGWTVNAFFIELEKIFNVSILVNNRSRVVSIILRNSFYAGCKSVHVRQATDIYEVEVEECDVNDPATSNMEYKFADSEFGRWVSLSDAVKNKAKYETIPESFGGPERKAQRVFMWFRSQLNKRTDTIYKDETDGREYMSLAGENETPDADTSYIMVNQFAKLERESARHTVELEIIPVAYKEVEINVYGLLNPTVYKLFLPAINAGRAAEMKQETLLEMIRNNYSEPRESKKAISLAFYTGTSSVKTISGLVITYPFPYVDEYTRNVMSEKGKYVYKINENGASLRFVTLDTLLYQGRYNIDYAHGIKINCYDPNLFDPRSIFEINNKRYICKEMEYTLDASGRKGAWQGTFCPIKISDTEADARWILSDGKWRDGGVWMDNGRWLD